MRLFTVGHSTRTWPEFRDLLLENQVECLVDVRQFPSSRRFPHFNREALEAALARASIRYRHERALGGRRTAVEGSLNDYWRLASFRGYADYMSTAEFAQALDRAREGAVDSRVVFMCAEAVPWRCHRQLIADALVASGVEVVHILGPGRHELHQLNAHASLDASGRLIYRADILQLPLEFRDDQGHLPAK